jgi:DNA-binding HxlR family transcriptional regulator
MHEFELLKNNSQLSDISNCHPSVFRIVRSCSRDRKRTASWDVDRQRSNSWIKICILEYLLIEVSAVSALLEIKNNITKRSLCSTLRRLRNLSFSSRSSRDLKLPRGEYKASITKLQQQSCSLLHDYTILYSFDTNHKIDQQRIGRSRANQFAEGADWSQPQEKWHLLYENQSVCCSETTLS